MVEITGLIIGIVFVGVVLVGSYFFKNRAAQTGKNDNPSGSRGCSIAFYVFLAVIIIGMAVAHMLYKFYLSQG